MNKKTILITGVTISLVVSDNLLELVTNSRDAPARDVTSRALSLKLNQLLPVIININYYKVSIKASVLFTG